MSKEIVEVMIEGGKAVANAALAQPLAPLKINLPDVIKNINDKTSSFKGMKVPVKVIVDTQTKEFEIEIGTPPVSELIKKELGVEKGSSMPNKNKIGNLALEQVVKIALMKQDSLLFNNFRSAVKTIAGSCNSSGVLIEGLSSSELNKKIDSGFYDGIIDHKKTEVSSEKKKLLQQQLTDIQTQIKKELERIEAEKKAEEAKSKKLVTEAEEVVKEAEKPEEGKVEAEPEKAKEEKVKKE